VGRNHGLAWGLQCVPEAVGLARSPSWSPRFRARTSLAAGRRAPSTSSLSTWRPGPSVDLAGGSTVRRASLRCGIKGGGRPMPISSRQGASSGPPPPRTVGTTTSNAPQASRRARADQGRPGRAGAAQRMRIRPLAALQHFPASSGQLACSSWRTQRRRIIRRGIRASLRAGEGFESCLCLSAAPAAASVARRRRGSMVRKPVCPASLARSLRSSSSLLQIAQAPGITWAFGFSSLCGVGPGVFQGFAWALGPAAAPLPRVSA